MKKSIKKSIVFSFLLFFGFSITIIEASPPVLLCGYDHSYTVILRDNKESFVYGRILITNPENKPLTEFSFEIPRVLPNEIAMYQINLPQECVRYEGSSNNCIKWGGSTNYKCDYEYKSLSDLQYQKIQFNKAGDFYHLTLPTPVDQHKSTVIVIAYTTKGYVKEKFGLFEFSFETIKVPLEVERIIVKVELDSNSFLKDELSRNKFFSEMNVEVPFLTINSLNEVVSQIGRSGVLSGTARNLSQNETLVLNGQYAKSLFRLYLSPIIIASLIIISISFGIYFSVKNLKKRRKNNSWINILDPTNALVSLLSVTLVTGFGYLLKWFDSIGLFFGFSDLFYFSILLVVVLIILVPAIIMVKKYGWKSFVSVLVADIMWFMIFFSVYLVLTMDKH
jgi:nitrate reductase NapE component